MFRLGGNGLLKVNVVVQIIQIAPAEASKQGGADFGGVVLRGGPTLVADVDGEVRHVVEPADAGPGPGRR